MCSFDTNRTTKLYKEGILIPKSFELAKQMEQDIISESWNDGNLIGRNGWIIEEYSTGKQYYKKKYKDK